MSVRRLAALCFLVSMVLPFGAAPAHAREVAMSLGTFEPLEDRNRSGEAGFEFRWAPRRLRLFSKDLEVIPFAAVSGTGSESRWIVVGGRLERSFGRRGFLSASVGVTYYFPGSGPDLGGRFHFRSMGEIGFRLDRRSRLALGLHHLSNAAIRDRNPGSESLVAIYSVALGRSP